MVRALKNMTNRLITCFAAMLMVQSAFAVSQCPGNIKDCGPNPFYLLYVGLSQVCSEKFPENGPSYKMALAKIVADNPGAHAKLDADAEFQKKLQILLREAEKMPLPELQNACAILH